MKMELFPKNFNALHWRTLQAICTCSQFFQLVYMAPRNSTQLLNINTTKFKECRDELSPFANLICKSFSENNIAQCLKSAAIVPVYKGGGASIPSNYRPISLTSIMMKILERVIRKQIIAFMTKRCVLTLLNIVLGRVGHAYRHC